MLLLLLPALAGDETAPPAAPAADPRAAAMGDGEAVAEVRVSFGTPTWKGRYDGPAYAAAFPAQWRDAGVGVCWLPEYRAMGAAPVDHTVRFLVGPDGHVAELEVPGVATEVLECLRLRARDWVLPPAERPVRVTQPVRLSRWGAGSTP